MIFDFRQVAVQPHASLNHVIKTIDSAGIQIALVVDNAGVLVGTVTDGDIRRGLLKGVGMNSLVSEVMNSAPKILTEGTTEETACDFMHANHLNHVPIINNKGQVISLVLNNSPKEIEKRSTPIILMAGGLGMRLRPLTEHLPKPMIPIGDKPLLERIINRFASQGFHHFILSLNYLGHLIREHFGDGTGYGVKIDYVEEHKRMGTGGALSLLKKYPDEPFIVMNGDILTTTLFTELIDFHIQTGSVATICARSLSTQIPYGVLNTKGTSLVSMQEKPVYKHLINAGIYALSPLVFEHIKSGEPLDLPDLITRLQDHDHKVSVLKINEYWLDIGRIEDLERAQTEHTMISKK
jgi:dTDP-glucose pyrophosphorylase